MNGDGNVTVRRKAYASHGGQAGLTEPCINFRHSQKLLSYLWDSEVVFLHYLEKKCCGSSCLVNFGIVAKAVRCVRMLTCLRRIVCVAALLLVARNVLFAEK